MIAADTPPRIRSALLEAEADDRRRFARRFAQSRRDAFNLTKAGARRVTGVLSEFRPELLDRLDAFSTDPDLPFLIRQSPAIRKEMAAAIAQLVDGASVEIRQSLEDAFFLGQGVTAGALQAANVPAVFPSISGELLASAAAATDTLLTEAGERLLNQVMRKVRFGAIGLEPSSATRSGIVDLLRTSKEVRQGVRRRIGFAFQADTIARTEIGRLYSNAQQAASEQISQQIPDLKKQWVTTLKDRRGHREVEERYAIGGSIGPIPVKSRFIVKDFSRTGTATFMTLGGKVRPPGFAGPGQRVIGVDAFQRRGTVKTDRMLFPRDPGASAGNVINCSCFVVDVVPGFEEVQQQALGVIDQGPPIGPQVREPRPEPPPPEPPPVPDGAEVRKNFLKRTERLQASVEKISERLDQQFGVEDAARNIWQKANPEKKIGDWWSTKEFGRIQEKTNRLAKQQLKIRQKRDGLIDDFLRKKESVKLDPRFGGFGKARAQKAGKVFERVERFMAPDALPERARSFKVDRVRGRGRSAYRKSELALRMADGAGERTFVHELGHHLEDHNPRIKKRVKEFLEARTRGETARRLRDLTGNLGYKLEEIAKKDRFINPYMGRIYDFDATEITSMGFEFITYNPVEFARKDPEYFELMVDILAGVF